ncbi:MAG TPA: hypothetical protein VN033_10225 [Vulgatibacter sp.]|nr:hypothetical protein [Vulgatibacter sp.]
MLGRLIVELGPDVRRLWVTWRTTDYATAVITAPGLEEAAAVELLKRAKGHLVMAGYRTRRPGGPPEVRVRHELCRACVRAYEIKRGWRAA